MVSAGKYTPHMDSTISPSKPSRAQKKTDPRKPTETAAAIQAGVMMKGTTKPTEDHTIPETNIYTLLGTNISPEKPILSRWFSFFPRWDMLISWRVVTLVPETACV